MRRRLAIALATLTVAAPAAGEPQSASAVAAGHAPASHPRLLEFPPSSWQPPTGPDSQVSLAGGAGGFLVSDSTLPLVDIVVVARVGADREPAELRGVAEFTATMLRRGGTRQLPPDRFNERADELGVIMRSHSTKLYGAATLRATTAVLADGVDLLFEMLASPGFDSERLASIKRNMEEGMSRRTLRPAGVLEREWEWLLFGASHFSTRPLRRADLEALTAAALAEFHRLHWRPENLTFAVSGDVDRERLTELLNPHLEAWTARLQAAEPTAVTIHAWPPAPPAAAPRSGLFQVHADIPQAKVALGHRAPEPLPTVEERVRLEVLAEILGGRGAISRLNGRLRSAEGLVYRVTTTLEPGDLWPADYRIVFDTEEGNTPRALAAALEEIDRLRTSPPHAEELAVVRRELMARQFDAFDTAEEAVGYLVQDWLVGRPPSYRSRYRDLLAQITPRDVLAAARRHLRPDELTVLLVGRWEGMRGRLDSAGVSELERIVGRRVERLPARDPLSLAALP